MIKLNQYKLALRVWVYDGPAPWYFVTIPKEVSSDIRNNFGDLKRGWGSLRVEVSSKNINWKTSIFPDSKTDCYMLPIKKEVRKSLGISADKVVKLTIKIIV